jgi:hypothetical protein
VVSGDARVLLELAQKLEPRLRPLNHRDRDRMVGDVEPTEAGLASGVVNTSFMMGGPLGSRS